MYRHHPQTRLVEQLVREGALGRLLSIRACFTFPLTDLTNVRASTELDGGALMDVGCYCVSGARLLAGEPVSVSAVRVDGPTGVDMAFHGTLRHEEDVVTQFEASFLAPRRQLLEVVGEDAVLTVQSPWRVDWPGDVAHHSRRDDRAARRAAGELVRARSWRTSRRPFPATRSRCSDATTRSGRRERSLRSLRRQLPLDGRVWDSRGYGLFGNPDREVESMKRSPRAARRSTTWLWLVIALAVGALAFVAAGCGGDDEASDDTTGTETTAAGGECDSTIWVLLPDSATSPRWETDDRKYFEDAFTEAGVDYNIVNSEGSAVTQQSQAEQAIADGAEVIVLTSNDTGSGATIIDIAKEAGVKVVEYDRFNTGGAGGDAYVSFDNEEVGRKMAEVLEPEIDALDVDTPAVVMLNGGEEDNNSFQFRAGYAETVEERVDAGDWTLAADQHVPGWGANGEGQGIMEQILTDNNNEIHGVFAANDNLAQQAINALEAAGVENIPVSGQDASAAGMQNIVLGKQTMSTYKPF